MTKDHFYKGASEKWEGVRGIGAASGRVGVREGQRESWGEGGQGRHTASVPGLGGANGNIETDRFQSARANSADAARPAPPPLPPPNPPAHGGHSIRPALPPPPPRPPRPPCPPRAGYVMPAGLHRAGLRSLEAAPPPAGRAGEPRAQVADVSQELRAVCGGMGGGQVRAERGGKG